MRCGIDALTKSLARRDKDNLFIVVEESQKYISLVDRGSRTRQNPKRKSRRHVQVIHDNDELQRGKLIEESGLTDEYVKHFIECYEKESVTEGSPQ